MRYTLRLFTFLLSTSVAVDAVCDEVVVLANQERANESIESPKLSCASNLNSVAQDYSDAMCTNDCFAHNCDGLPKDRLDAAGVTYLTNTENLARSQKTPEEVMSAWMASSHHRANILGAQYDEVGIGYNECGGVRYWTMVLINTGNGSNSGGGGGAGEGGTGGGGGTGEGGTGEGGSGGGGSTGGSGGGGSGKPTSRRALQIADLSPTTLSESDEKYVSMVDKCGEFDYELSLVVDNHFYGVGSPNAAGVRAGCPHVVMDARFTSTEGPYEKKFMIFDDEKELNAIFGGDDKLTIGTFKGSEVVRAHESIDPSTSSNVYDIVSNNCADLMIAMANELGIKIDNKMISFVGTRLLKNASKEFMDSIREALTSHFPHLFEGRRLRRADGVDSSSNKSLIDFVVKTRAAELLFR